MKRQIDDYLKKLPEERRGAVTALRKVLTDNLPDGYVETLSYGMLSYEVPLSVYPDTYNGKPLMYAALASQKSHMALYLCNAYGQSPVRAKLEKAFARAGKKLDMGKSCLRFQRLDDLALDGVAAVIAATPLEQYVALAKRTQTPEAKAARKKARGGGKPSSAGTSTATDHRRR